MEVVLAHLEAARTVAHHGGLYHTNAEVKLQGESRALQTWASLYSLAPPFPPNAHSRFSTPLSCSVSLIHFAHPFSSSLTSSTSSC